MSIHTSRPLPWWVGGDLNAAFGLGFNVLVNVLVLTSLCVGVVQIRRLPCSASSCPHWASSC
jgi:hypothetical protein